ncbi:hypothetical protein [Streptomyces sp. MMS24-I29]|uniref:hypothetical protein n=1 Tax=Streptomyces sp. MMS24-I29 TaxID=3351480 RepID=UPI003C7D7F6D
MASTCASGDEGVRGLQAAQWSLTDSLRQGLHAQGTLVIGVHAGFVDTNLSAWTDAPKISAEAVAEMTMDALTNDQLEVLRRGGP